MGDFSFVKLVTERTVKGDENQCCLDYLCQDLGWSPLHYAAACGWSDIVELLLASGCDVGVHTDPNLTCFMRYVLSAIINRFLSFVSLMKCCNFSS